MDFQLNSDGDILIENGEFPVVTGPDAVAQHVVMRIRTWLAECIYDRSVGVPYIQIIFTQRGITEVQVEFILRGVIETVPGVDEIISLDLELDRALGTLSGTGKVLVQEEPVDFTFIAGGEL